MSDLLFTCTPYTIDCGESIKYGNCCFYDNHIDVTNADGKIVKALKILDYADLVLNKTIKTAFFSKKHILLFSFKNFEEKAFLELCFKKEKDAAVCFSCISGKIAIDTETRKKTDIYNYAILLQEQNTKESLQTAIERFDSIKGWQDSDKKIAECRASIDIIIEAENKAKQDKYEQAVALSKNDTIESLEKAIELLPNEWNDSTQLAIVFQKRIDCIKEAQENERKQRLYDSAVSEAKKDTISSYQKAIRVLSSLNEWKDSRQLITSYNKRIVAIKQKEEEDRKDKIYDDALKLSTGNIIKNYEAAIKLFSEIEDWKDSKTKIDDCKRSIQRIQDAHFYKTIEKTIDSCKNQPDETDKYDSAILSFSKHASDLFLKNPFFVLGVSTISSNKNMLDVKDKIEKFARLKMAGAYKSTFDLKNIKKPARDISNIQSAIVSAKKLSSKWLFFATDKYCCWWDCDKIFDLYEKEKSENEYDLILACYINRIISDPTFTDKKKWNMVLSAIGSLLEMNDDIILPILQKHILPMNDQSDQSITDSFKKTIVKPMTFLLEESTIVQLNNFAKLVVPKSLSEVIFTAVVSNVTNICFPLEIYVKEIENDTTKVDISKLLSLMEGVEEKLYKNIDSYISIVGANSTYAKRIKKKYKEAIWNSTNVLNSNNNKNRSIPFIKEIYDYCDENDKSRLRNTYGYDKLGLTENDLSPDELNDIALQKENEGYISEGIRLMKIAADRGSAFAQSNIAFRYFEGKGVPQNKGMAKLYWLKAAAQGNQTAQAALDNLFEIPHEHYDLGYVYVGYGEQKYVEVSLNLIAYVRLLDNINYRLYINRENYNYYGGRQTQSPVRIGIPHSGSWHVVVDNDGDPMGAITSYSCYTKTVNNYYY